MTRYILTSLALATLPMLFSAAEAVAETPATDAVKKSIVPAKYAGKYKNGGDDELAEFIKTQCTGKDGFEYLAFFELCRKNGIAEEKVKTYEDAIANKAHGSQGRARMTLRNMLATFVRKNGKLVGLDGTETPLTIAKPALTGAAAAAQANAASTETETASEDSAETEVEDNSAEV